MAGNAVVTALDVRPLLAAGEEPFSTIMAAANDIAAGGVLELTAPFEPVPLYDVMSRRGFAHSPRPRGSGEWVVRFVQTGITGGATVGDVHRANPETAPVLAEMGLDLCCGGSHTLEFAARAHGLELNELLRRLQQAVAGA